MQDRFKFRVWHKKRKKMYDVLHFHTQTWDHGGEWVTAKGFNIITQQDIHIQVEPKDGVIMQCTGIKDKNGKLIYEGDIVSVKVETQDFFGEDEYYSENYKGEIIFEKGEIAIDVIDTTKHPISLYYHTKDCEIIGNIYENSELILEDKCKYCSVEAQAMVHRCPECKYNPELLNKEDFPLNTYRIGGLDLNSDFYKKASQLIVDPTSDLLQELKFAKYIRNNNEGKK